MMYINSIMNMIYTLNFLQTILTLLYILLIISASPITLKILVLLSIHYVNTLKFHFERNYVHDINNYKYLN